MAVIASVNGETDNRYFWLIEFKVYNHGGVDQIGWSREVAITSSEAIGWLRKYRSGQGKLKILSIKREELYRESTQPFLP